MKNYCIFPFSVGNVLIAQDANGICDIIINAQDDFEGECKITPLIASCAKQLDEYFKGERKEFDLQLSIDCGNFFRLVYKRLCENVRFGKTITYKELARLCGNENAARAVANANNKNKLPIIIPCHRVIGANGKLVGYRYGIAIKEFLINLEKEYC